MYTSENVPESLRQASSSTRWSTKCAPAYCEESRGGRPGIDPVVYLKMLMVAFFENLRSERAIAARCEDSLSCGRFWDTGLKRARPITAV